MIEEIAGTIAEALLEPIVASPISTCVQTVEWNPTDQTMRITFVSGKTYDYPSISRQQVQDLLNAPSVGAYLNANFRMK